MNNGWLAKQVLRKFKGKNRNLKSKALLEIIRELRMVTGRLKNLFLKKKFLLEE
jgi:hypothetical protein